MKRFRLLAFGPELVVVICLIGNIVIETFCCSECKVEYAGTFVLLDVVIDAPAYLVDLDGSKLLARCDGYWFCEPCRPCNYSRAGERL